MSNSKKQSDLLFDALMMRAQAEAAWAVCDLVTFHDEDPVILLAEIQKAQKEA